MGTDANGYEYIGLHKQSIILVIMLEPEESEGSFCFFRQASDA
jgi:hypothetical protein